MADVITRLKLETTQYDSKLRNAAKDLSDFAREASKAGSDFQKLAQGNMEAARSFGNIATSSTNVKDKLKELVSAYNTAAKAYNNLTEEQKKDDWGKALAQSLSQLSTRIRETKAEMQGLGNELAKAKGGGIFGGKLDGMLAVFGGNLLTKAAGMASNLALEIGDAVKEGIELAKAGEGIRMAFERLDHPDLLNKLREATHGTVTDLELMKQAVKFNDFNLSLSEMGTMLAFAQQKAKDTGQSVDYMVDSIVTGLGRKSLMILDNLGLSAADIKEKMKSTGDMTKAVGEIIREQMSSAGDYVETAADRAAQANVSLQNKMEELGRKFAPVEEASNQLWTSMKIAILDVVGGPLARLLNGLTEAGRLRNALNDMNGDAGSGSGTKVGQQLKKLEVIKKAGGSDFVFKSIQQGVVDDYNRQIDTVQKKIDYAQNAMKNGGMSAVSIRNSMENLIAQRNALMAMRDEYIAGAKDILNPAATGTTTVPTVPTTTKKTKTTRTGTHKVTPQERAAEMVANAERTYSETLTKNSIRLEAGIDTTLENKKKELSAQERLFDAYSDAYATYKDPKYKTAIDDSAEKLKSLSKEVNDMEEEVRKSKEKWEKGPSGFNAATMAAWMTGRQGDLSNATYGSSEYANTMANIADINTIKTILEQSFKAGIDASQFDLEPLWEKVFDGENIPDETWQSMVDVINEKLKAMELEPIKIDFNTGEIDSTAKKAKEGWQDAAQAVQAVGGALQQLEDPGAKIMGIIGEAIANIALGFAQATAKTGAAGGIFGWIAAIAGGLGTMVSTIAAIKSATAGSYAEGGIIPGNNYNDGLIANVSSGELILNRAQQNSIAGQLASSQGNGESRPYVDVETIWLGMGHYLKRKGMGEIVTTR